MKSGGVQLFILQKWGGQILKWGGRDPPTFNGGDAPAPIGPKLNYQKYYYYFSELMVETLRLSHTVWLCSFIWRNYNNIVLVPINALYYFRS